MQRLIYLTILKMSLISSYRRLRFTLFPSEDQSITRDAAFNFCITLYYFYVRTHLRCSCITLYLSCWLVFLSNFPKYSKVFLNIIKLLSMLFRPRILLQLSSKLLVSELMIRYSSIVMSLNFIFLWILSRR